MLVRSVRSHFLSTPFAVATPGEDQNYALVADREFFANKLEVQLSDGRLNKLSPRFDTLLCIELLTGLHVQFPTRFKTAGPSDWIVRIENGVLRAPLWCLLPDPLGSGVDLGLPRPWKVGQSVVIRVTNESEKPIELKWIVYGQAR